MRRIDRQRAVSYRSLPRIASKKPSMKDSKANRSLGTLKKNRSVSPIKEVIEHSLPQKSPVRLPSITATNSPPKLIKPLKPSISIPMVAIKRRFKNARKLIRLVPENDFELSIQENSPFIGTILDRNWAKKTEDLSTVVPVYENRWEEDEVSSRDEAPTPAEMQDWFYKYRILNR
mmetsp:Transcript_21859/g.39856  ORF Transcript_21859/g.39856 Transcript_21859/m.39856 type:complete len:175 (-) Transcript_21859:636-1160(-)